MAQKHKELSESEWNQIVDAWKCITVLTIVKRLKIVKSTVQDVIDRYKNTGEIKFPAWREWLHLLNDRDKCHLLQTVKKNRKLIINELQNEFAWSTSIEVATRTLQHYLHEGGVYAPVGKRKSFMN